MVMAKRQPTLLRQRADQRGEFLHQRVQVEWLVGKVEAAGFDARQVEGIVDQPQQMLAGATDRTDKAALLRIERRGQQQLAHAEHAGHRRAHLVAERGQEAGLRLRGLLGEILLLLCQLPGMAALQALAIGARDDPDKGDAGKDERHNRPPRPPPRRLHVEADGLYRRPHVVRRPRLDLQAVVAGFQAREQSFSRWPGIDPAIVVAVEAKPIGVVVRVVEGEEAGDDAEIAVVVADRELCSGDERMPGIATQRIDGFDRQPRRSAAVLDRRGIEDHQPPAGAGEDAAVPGAKHRRIRELLSRQAVVHTVDAHRAIRGVHADQAAHAGQPDAAVAIDHQAAGFKRRKTAARVDRGFQAQRSTVPAIRLQRTEAREPDAVALAQRETEHVALQCTRHGFETSRTGIPRQQALRARQPQGAVRAASDLVDEDPRRQARGTRRHRALHAPLLVADLHAVFRGKPQQAVRGLGEAGLAKQGGIGAARAGPARHFASGGMHPHQAFLVTRPNLAAPVLEHVGEHITRAQVAGNVLRCAGFGIEPVEYAAGAHQPHVTAGRRRDATDMRVRDRRGHVVAPRQHREPAPIGRQVPQAAVVADEPQSAFAVLVRADPRRPHRPARWLRRTTAPARCGLLHPGRAQRECRTSTGHCGRVAGRAALRCRPRSGPTATSTSCRRAGAR